MKNADLQPDDNLTFRTHLEEAAAQSKELRQVIDRIVEEKSHDKAIQELDHLVDVARNENIRSLGTRVTRREGSARRGHHSDSMRFDM